VPTHDDVDKLDIALQERCLVEAVVGPEFFGLDQTVRESRFRSRFRAAILSVCRQGHRLDGKIGDIQLQTGDTLLLEASDDFVSQYRSRRDFLLVSALNESTPPDFAKAPVAIGTLLLMVLVSASGVLSILEASLVAAGVMLASRCVSVSKARRNVDLSVLVVIASSFALGAAMVKTGNASMIANGLLFYEGISPWQALILMYLITVIFTELITNNAAAVLMFPVAMALADQLGVSYMPFVIAIMFAASASFITPLGYQTNLMVYGPGGYRFTDYARLGIPLSLTVGVVSLFLIPQIWHF
jgi:di/tricarboxylate transporter